MQRGQWGGEWGVGRGSREGEGELKGEWGRGRGRAVADLEV